MDKSSMDKLSTQFEVGSAFSSCGWGGGSGGMSLRDWFAGQALAGVCGANGVGWLNDQVLGQLVADAYAIADAMLEAGGWGRRVGHGVARTSQSKLP